MQGRSHVFEGLPCVGPTSASAYMGSPLPHSSQRGILSWPYHRWGCRGPERLGSLSNATQKEHTAGCLRSRVLLLTLKFNPSEEDRFQDGGPEYQVTPKPLVVNNSPCGHCTRQHLHTSALGSGPCFRHTDNSEAFTVHDLMGREPL